MLYRQCATECYLGFETQRQKKRAQSKKCIESQLKRADDKTLHVSDFKTKLKQVPNCNTGLYRRAKQVAATNDLIVNR